jgi:hypothetical protein
MSRHNKNLCLAALLLVAYALGASAQSTSPRPLSPTAAGLSGGAFQLKGTLGPAPMATLSAAGYRFYGRFWLPSSDASFANVFDK